MVEPLKRSLPEQEQENVASQPSLGLGVPRVAGDPRARPDPLGTGAEGRRTRRGPGKRVEVYNLVEGPTPIISIKPEGTRLEKGELVCELESFALKEKRSTQEGVTKAAETAYRNARRAREVAELAVTEYVEWTFKQELQTLNGRIALGEARVKGPRGSSRQPAPRREGHPPQGTPLRRRSAPAAGQERARQECPKEVDAGAVHQGEDDQVAPGRGREGACRGAGKAGGVRGPERRSRNS